MTRNMLVCVLACSLFSPLCFSQEIPKGVNYKNTSPEINTKAKAALEAAIHSKDVPKDIFGDNISCGPTLWNDLKDQQAELSKDSTPLTIFLSLPDPFKVEGRGLRTPKQEQLFWKDVLAKFPELQTGTVRPAHAKEIQYFWTTIPFDIEEPFFAIETPHSVFIVNMLVKGGNPTLFWMDRVDNLHKLKP